MELDLISTQQAAEKWGLTERHVQSLYQHPKNDGIVRLGRSQLIPKDATRPIDAYKSRKNTKKED